MDDQYSWILSAIGIPALLAWIERRHKTASNDKLELEKRIRSIEDGRIRDESKHQAIDELKVDVKELEDKMDRGFDRIFSLLNQMASRMEIPAVRGDDGEYRR